MFILKNTVMKFLHTSDWHIGADLYGRKRYDEFERFLDWLAGFIEEEQVELLLVAGDIFHTTTPGNRAQALYFSFLHRLSSSSCRHVVLTAGNHDSPTFLDAPRELLRHLQIHVVGESSPDPSDEVLLLEGPDGRPEAVIGAVPYLRDRDIRTVSAGESPGDKTQKLLDGIARHYREVCRHAHEVRHAAGGNLPMLVTGHLFAAGGTTVEGDGVREIYVGSLARVDAGAFPQEIDYLALGHLHCAQRVGGHEHMRYSGSPLPMGFGEAGRAKSVIVGTTEGRTVTVREHPVPCFQSLERITGDLQEITSVVRALQASGSTAWLDIDYTGTLPALSLRHELDALMETGELEILRIRNRHVADLALGRMGQEEELVDLGEEEVFRRCLEKREANEEEYPHLLEMYREILRDMHEDDSRAE